VTLNTRGRFNKLIKSIFVLLEKPEKKRISLVITAYIKPVYKVIPPRLDFGRVSPGTAVIREALLLPAAEEPLVIKRHEVRGRFFSADIFPVRRKGREGFGVRVILGPDAPIGHVNGMVRLITESRKQAAIIIPFYGIVESDVTVQPKIIFFGTSRRATPPARIISVRKNGKPDLEVIDVEAEPPSLHADLVTVTKGSQYHIKVRMGPEMPLGPFSGEVRVFLNSPHLPLVRIPVFAHIQGVIRLSPEAVCFEKAMGDPSPIGKVTLSAPGRKLKVLSYDIPHGSLRVEGSSAGRKGGFDFIVNLSGDATPGKVSTYLTIRTDLPGEETVKVPIKGVIRRRPMRMR
jgi:hypothetical protein